MEGSDKVTRKDYIRIAQAIREQYEDSGTDVEKAVLRLVTYKLCTALKADNYRFDREKFIKAATGL